MKVTPAARVISRSFVPLVLVLLSSAGPARGAPNDAMLAESLYQSGKALFAEGKYAEACPKLAESQRLDPAGGTALLLATCYDRASRTASAIIAYQDALAIARRDRRDDRVKQATERLKALEAEVPRLKITLSPQASALGEKLEVTRDGEPVVKAAMGVDLLVDPGKHVVRASAPGRVAIELPVELAPRERKEITVPALALAPAPEPVAPPPSSAPLASAPAPSPSPPSSPPPSPSPGEAGRSVRGTVGLVSIGVGALLVGGGVYLGVKAYSQRSKANDRCPDQRCGDEAAVEQSKQALGKANAASVLLPVGLLAAGAGVYLVLSDRGEQPQTAARISPFFGPGLVGASLARGF